MSKTFLFMNIRNGNGAIWVQGDETDEEELQEKIFSLI